MTVGEMEIGNWYAGDHTTPTPPPSTPSLLEVPGSERETLFQTKSEEECWSL